VALVPTAPLPASSSSRTGWHGPWSSAIRPVRGRVSPYPSRTALPSCRPQCGCRTVEVGSRRRQPGFPL